MEDFLASHLSELAWDAVGMAALLLGPAFVALFGAGGIRAGSVIFASILIGLDFEPIIAAYESNSLVDLGTALASLAYDAAKAFISTLSWETLIGFAVSDTAYQIALAGGTAGVGDLLLTSQVAGAAAMDTASFVTEVAGGWMMYSNA